MKKSPKSLSFNHLNAIIFWDKCWMLNINLSPPRRIRKLSRNILMLSLDKRSLVKGWAWKPLQNLWQSQPCHGQKLLPISMCFVQSVGLVNKDVNGSSWNFIMSIVLLKADAYKHFKHEDILNCFLNMVSRLKIGMLDHKNHNKWGVLLAKNRLHANYIMSQFHI